MIYLCFEYKNIENLATVFLKHFCAAAPQFVEL